MACILMTSSNGKFFVLLVLCAGNSPVTGDFPTQRPVTRSFDVFFDLRLNKRLSKQPSRRWFETVSHSSWVHCYVVRYHSFTNFEFGLWIISTLFERHNHVADTPIMWSSEDSQSLQSRKSSWRHHLEAFNAQLVLCAGNSPVTGEFPLQRASNADFDVSFMWVDVNAHSRTLSFKIIASI